ncbi:Hypothetical protein NTJ_13203 [Nesidiocoris tenuis]|uniref:Uncharacterized protein n=1 Tax=Nesidiocoris tenuis TaxID=355587 RepID=A0ABN7B7L9_9HEMI|nr:Hypothetical protein NTJ_13203 [Nesidiocoris tenuis]
MDKFEPNMVHGPGGGDEDGEDLEGHQVLAQRQQQAVRRRQQKRSQWSHRYQNLPPNAIRVFLPELHDYLVVKKVRISTSWYHP